MPYFRPTLPTLLSRGKADIDTRLRGTMARLRWTAEAVLAKAAAGLAHGLYGFIEWVSKQAVPNPQMDTEMLYKWADLSGDEFQPKPATSAKGNLLFIGRGHVDGQIDARMPKNTLWQRADGVRFVTTQDKVGIGAEDSVEINAVLTGLAGNCDPFEPLTLVTPVAGFQSSGRVDANGIKEGADKETNDALLKRLLFRWRNGKAIGQAGSYVQWALTAPDVTRAWELPGYLGLGTVAVVIAADTQLGFAPDPDTITGAQDIINALRPLTVQATVLGALEHAINVTLHGVPVLLRLAAEAQINDYFLNFTAPGLPVVPSEILDAILRVPLIPNTATVTAPAAPVVLAPGELPKLGVLTFT